MTNKCIATPDTLGGEASQRNYGILGAVVTNLQGHRVDPLLQARNMGLHMIEAVTYFWTALISNVYNTLVSIMHGYIWRMILTSTVSALAAGLVGIWPGSSYFRANCCFGADIKCGHDDDPF